MTTNNYPPQLVLQQLIRGFQVTQCIYIAANFDYDVEKLKVLQTFG